MLMRGEGRVKLIVLGDVVNKNEKYKTVVGAKAKKAGSACPNTP